MQPYPGPGQDPNTPPSSPFDTPGYGAYPAQPPAPEQPYADPYAPQQPYQPQPPVSAQPYGAQPPVSGQPYGAQPPVSGQPYPGQAPGYGYQAPVSGQPYPGQQPPYPGQAPAYGYQAPVVYPGGYTVPGYAPPAGRNNTLGLLGMIFGIASIVLVVCCGFLAIPLGGAGVVLGILGINKAKQGLADNRGMALAGVICGAIGLTLSIAYIVLSVVLHFGTYTFNNY
jgi:hypothetical protein